MGKLDFQKKLEAFQNALDFPKWYLGMSDYQEQTAKELCNDLRDDFEQGTSYRVEKSLIRLGLSPMISKKKIRTMVQLSRGNDLAFLYFILEGYYTSCRKNGEFSTNEKLLMITLAKIDLMPTLRELDRILPPPQLSALELKNQRRTLNLLKNTKPPPEPATPPPKKPTTKSPYFQRQTRPKEIVVNYLSKPPKLLPKFPFWQDGQPPNYGPKTKRPWFADYNLNPVGRLVKRTVGEAVDKHFNHLNYMKDLESRARVSHRAALVLQQAQKKEQDDEIQLCARHRCALAEAQLVKDELTVLARDRCMELMDVTLPYRKIRHRRILAQLEHDVDNCLKRYALKMESTTVHTISKHDCIICQEQRADFPAAKPHDRKGRALVGDCLNLAHTEATERCVGVRLSGGGLRREPIEFEGELGYCKDLMDRASGPSEPDPKSCQGHEETNTQRISFQIDANKLRRLRKNRKDKSVDGRYQGKQTKKSFFNAPTDHKPYQFKYKRIFKTGLDKPQDIKKFIDKAFINALDTDDAAPKPKCEKHLVASEDENADHLLMEVNAARLTDSCASTDDTSEHSRRSHEDRKSDIVNAVVRCAKEIWMKGVNTKRAEMELAEERERNRTRQTSILTYDDDKIDADNSELMNRMLKDGLAELRKNPRFVLASLPDAHKLPVLQEWIRRRYGKLYTEEDIQKSMRESLKVFEMIMLLQGNPPSADLMGMDHLPKDKENFANYGKAKALANKVRAEYYKKLNDIYMDHTIACWYAMGNYLVRSGPPRKTFFAYMSSNTRDIMRNKVWNGEYRNIKRFRERYRETHKQ